MNRSAVCFVTCVLLLLATPLAAQTAKIGVFDSLRVSEETEEGKRVQAELRKYLEGKQAEIAAKEKELTDLQSRITSQGLSLSDERKASLEREAQRKLLELNSMREAAMREWQLERSEAGGAFEQQLLRVVQEFGKRENFALLLDRSQVAYAADTVDVTTALVDLFNQLVPPATDSGD